MTIDKDRKRSIRERMARTGETYVVARMHQLAMLAAGTVPSLDPDRPIELTDAERDELAALWLEIRVKHELVPRELTYEPFFLGIGVSSMAAEWPGKKEYIDDLEARMKAVAQRVAAQGDAAVRDWIVSRDRPDADDSTAQYTAADEALLAVWLDLRKAMAQHGVEVAPGAPLLAHELANFGDPRTWREMRPVLARIRKLVAERSRESSANQRAAYES